MFAKLVKNGLSFTATGIVTSRLHRLQDIQVGLLHFAAGQIHVGGNAVNVQLQGVRAGLLDLLGVFASSRRPTSRSGWR